MGGRTGDWLSYEQYKQSTATDVVAFSLLTLLHIAKLIVEIFRIHALILCLSYRCSVMRTAQRRLKRKEKW